MVTPPRSYLLPPGRFVRRARGPYVYDQHGDRYLDVWLHDGAAFLGHRPRGYAQLAKAEIDRGLWGPFPTKWLGRLEKAGRSLASLITSTIGTEIASLRVINGCQAGGIAGVGRWFPLGGVIDALSSSAPGSTVEIANASPGVEVYRGATGERISVVVPAPGLSVVGASQVGELSSLVIALLTKGIGNVVNFLQSPEAEDRLARSVDRPVPPGYTRSGVWSIPSKTAAGEDAEEEMRRWNIRLAHGWEKGLLLPPDPWTPIVLPPDLSTYDETIWQRVCDEWPI